MAEVNSFNKDEQVAGRKMAPSYHNYVKCAFIRMPDSFSQLAIGDTVASGVFLPAGARIADVVIRNGTGTASSTLDVGLRKRSDGTVVDATALAALHPITTASGGAKVISGTKLAAGLDYALADDCEIYLTAKGAVLAANQDLQVLVFYTAP